MSTVDELHELAMMYADEFILESKMNNICAARDAAKKAYQHEYKAAAMLSPTKDNEPTRAILYKSAASIAFDIEEYDLAEHCVANGLAGFPDSLTKLQLRDLYIKILQRLDLLPGSFAPEIKKRAPDVPEIIIQAIKRLERIHSGKSLAFNVIRIDTPENITRLLQPELESSNSVSGYNKLDGCIPYDPQVGGYLWRYAPGISATKQDKDWLDLIVSETKLSAGELNQLLLNSFSSQIQNGTGRKSPGTNRSWKKPNPSGKGSRPWPQTGKVRIKQG